jgi:hypothetical protein
MSNEEITKDILVAILGKVNLPTKIGEDKYPALWAAEAYKIIYKAIAETGQGIIGKQE